MAVTAESATSNIHGADALATLDAVLDAIRPENVALVSDDPALRTRAQRAGARTVARGHDLNASLQRSCADWAKEFPDRAAAIIVGPFTKVTGDDIRVALSACAAAEAAMIATQDGGTSFLTHFDPARLTARFGGPSSSRHQRHHAVVGKNLVAVRTRPAPSEESSSLASPSLASPTSSAPERTHRERAYPSDDSLV